MSNQLETSPVPTTKAPPVFWRYALPNMVTLAALSFGLTFAAACALRLARFNVRASDPAQPIWRGHFFTGVPAPAAAFLSLAPLYGLYADLFSQDAAARFAIFWMPFVALLMVSTWPTFSSKSMTRKALRLFFVPTLIASAAAIAGLYFAPWATLTACCGIYLLTFPLSKLRFNRQMARNA
jgi:CDP-diacylglycerol--serine O-phosphatidyltransferase